MICDDCKTETVFDVRGEHTCVECGLVSRIPVLVDTRFVGAGYTDTDDNYCSDNESLVREALHLNTSMAMDMMAMYTKYLATGVKASARKHVTIMAVCVYATCEARTIDDICMGLRLDSSEFNKTMKQMNITPPDKTVSDNVASVRNKLRLKGGEGFEFAKRCTNFHRRIIGTPNGAKILGQVKATKLFAVIGHIVLRDMMKIQYKDDDIFKLLNVTKPTVKKIENIICQFA
jgi:hypothetical protein